MWGCAEEQEKQLTRDLEAKEAEVNARQGDVSRQAFGLVQGSRFADLASLSTRTGGWAGEGDTGAEGGVGGIQPGAGGGTEQAGGPAAQGGAVPLAVVAGPTTVGE